MIKIATNNIDDFSIKSTLEKLAKKSDHLVFAVAFLKEKQLVEGWLDSNKFVSLIICLRPPTDYYVLKEILHRERLQVFHFRDNFHSKIYGFYEGGKIRSSIIGSS